MQKLILPILILMSAITSLAHASLDSVGVFYRSDKSVVLIEERQGAPRLQGFMDALGADASFYFQSTDESVRIQCGRSLEAASCTFRFYPSESVELANRAIVAMVDPAELKAVQGSYEMYFESSRADQFHLLLSEEGLFVKARKK